MTPVYTQEVRAQAGRKLRGNILYAAILFLLALCIGAAAILEEDLSWQRGVVSLTSAAVLCIAAYGKIQRKILPLYRTDRLMGELAQGERVKISGTFSGVRDAKTVRGKLLMYKLRIDAGGRVRGEPAEREVDLPAVFSGLSIRDGEYLEAETVKNILVSANPPIQVYCRPTHGAYRMSPLACALIVLLCAAYMGGVYAFKQSAAAEYTLQISVCTPAHHNEAQLAIETELEENNLPSAAFHYTGTVDREAVALYLATHGAFETDILLLSSGNYASVFSNEGRVLDVEKVEAALGIYLKYVTNGAGEPTGVILYDPADDGYNQRFSALMDWIAVEADVPLVAAIRSETRAGGSAEAALICILQCLKTAN